MTSARNIPEDYPRLRAVTSSEDFFTTPFSGLVNAVWMPRIIQGDYEELARQLYMAPSWCEQVFEYKQAIRNRLEQIATFEDGVGQAARQVLMDQDMVIAHGLQVDFRVAGANYYEYDVYTAHMDVGDPRDACGTFSCGYTEPTTEWARNDDCITTGRTREGVPLFTVRPDAARHRFSVGDMFRMAALHNQNKVDGFIHWAPQTRGSDGLRMMLMARSYY